jgi:hypothetical protein
MSWYRIVGFGPHKAPKGVSDDYKETLAALWHAVDKANDDGYTEANTKVYTYRTREQARNGDISHDIGRNGRIA